MHPSVWRINKPLQSLSSTPQRVHRSISEGAILQGPLVTTVAASNMGSGGLCLTNVGERVSAATASIMPRCQKQTHFTHGVRVSNYFLSLLSPRDGERQPLVNNGAFVLHYQNWENQHRAPYGPLLYGSMCTRPVCLDECACIFLCRILRVLFLAEARLCHLVRPDPSFVRIWLLKTKAVKGILQCVWEKTPIHLAFCRFDADGRHLFGTTLCRHLCIEQLA